MNRLARSAVVLALMFLLGACAERTAQVRPPRRSHSQVEDSAPPIPIDLDKIAEPVPKAENLSRYGNHSPYQVFGERYYVMPDGRGYVARGIASWYGTKFHGKLTSNREPYDMYAFSAAHKTLPLPSYARVTNLDNGRSIVVRINDRGPFVGNRLIDLSYVAAVKLGVHIKGTAPVEVRVLDPLGGNDSIVQPLADTPPLQAAEVASVTPPRRAPDSPAPVLVESGPSTANAVSDSQTPLPRGVYLQFGAFGAADNARMLRGRLHGAGIERINLRSDAGAGPWRVLVGPFGDRIEALAAQKSAAAKGFSGTRIVER